METYTGIDSFRLRNDDKNHFTEERTYLPRYIMKNVKYLSTCILRFILPWWHMLLVSINVALRAEIVLSIASSAGTTTTIRMRYRKPSNEVQGFNTSALLSILLLLLRSFCCTTGRCKFFLLLDIVLAALLEPPPGMGSGLHSLLVVGVVFLMTVLLLRVILLLLAVRIIPRGVVAEEVVWNGENRMDNKFLTFSNRTLLLTI